MQVKDIITPKVISIDATPRQTWRFAHLTRYGDRPICEVSPATVPGQSLDFLMLKYEIPMQWQDGCSYLMNQRTFALLQTMRSAEGRPLSGAQGSGRRAPKAIDWGSLSAAASSPSWMQESGPVRSQVVASLNLN